MNLRAFHDAAAADQAQGLRQLFAGARPRHLALVANPHVAFGHVMLERLTTVLDAMGLATLVVDAAESSPAPQELAALDLRACIEPLSSRVSYLAARGLPLRHVDTRGSAAQLLERLQAAAPHCRVLLVHAGASDLARLYARHALRPMLLAADGPQSITQAYASMKLLALRNGLMSYDLLLAAPPAASRTPAIAERLASCADSFLGAALHDWAAVDPCCDVRESPGPALMRLVAAQLQSQADPDADVLPAALPPPLRGRAASRSAAPLN